MKTSVLLDTNIILTKVLPNATWKKVIEDFFDELKGLISKNQDIEVNTTGLIKWEISKIIEEITSFLSEEYRTIISGMTELDQKADQEKLKQLQKKFNIAIIAQQEEKTRERNRNLLMAIEHYLLKIIRDNPTKVLKELLFEAFTFINNFEVQLNNSVKQLLLSYKINQLQYPQELQEQRKIENLINQLPMDNDPDKKILAFFLYYLDQKHYEGFFVTHDFGDFHAYAPALHNQFQKLTIIRPGYLSCFYQS